MRIAFLSTSLSRAAGGIFEIEKSLALTLSRMPDTTVEVYGLQDEFTIADDLAWHPLRTTACTVIGSRAFGYSPRLTRTFLSSSADIAHLHVLWMYTSILIHRWSHKHRKPYMITLNGMLDSWALQNSKWKKRLAAFLYESRTLTDSACIHVNTEAELVTARSFGLKNAVAVIPNGVNLPPRDDSATAVPHELDPIRARGNKILLYLGRLHPKKGLPNLIAAFSRVHQRYQDWVLVIAGWSELDHGNQLRRLANSLDLKDQIIFVGRQDNLTKYECLLRANAFIVPSYSEGLPMAVLEAWASAIPVLMTTACNLPIGYSAGAAIRIEPDISSIEEGLHALFNMTNARQREMGQNGRSLVATNFSWISAAQQIRSVYEWLLSGGPVPQCVDFPAELK